MKTKILVTVVLSILTILLIYGCGNRWNNSSALNETICLNYPDDISQLPVQLVHDMVTGYKKNQLNVINTEMTLSDAHSIWFDLETLKKFVYHIESTTKKIDQTISSEDLGVRIYFASYPDKMLDKASYNGELQKFKNNNFDAKNYGKLHTLVMIPTRKKGELNIDFNPLDKDTYNNNLNNLNYYSSKKEDETNNRFQSIFALSVSSSSNSTTSLNHGSLIPPGDPAAEGF